MGEIHMTVNRVLIWTTSGVRSAPVTTRQDRIRREMKRRKITQADLAKALDVAPRTVGRVLTGERDIPETLWLIEEHLGVPHTEAEAAEADVPEADVERWSDALLYARLTQLVAESQRRLAEARAQERPSPGSKGNVPQHLRADNPGPRRATGAANTNG